MMAKIEEFDGPQLTEPEMAEVIQKGERRVVIIRQPIVPEAGLYAGAVGAGIPARPEDTRSRMMSTNAGHIVSLASLVTETGEGAMIIGVATLPEFRGRGYASACVAHLVKYLNDKHKFACLFYHNPVAGRIYLRLGFRNVGRWRMAFFGR